MTAKTDGIRVTREGTVTRVFVSPSQHAGRLVIVLSLAVIGLIFFALGVYRLVVAFAQSGMLDADGFLAVFIGFMMLVVSYSQFPREGAWTHLFIFDGEAAYCLDPSGKGSGLREPVDSLRLEPHSRHHVIAGSQGPLGQPLSLSNGEAVLEALHQAAAASPGAWHMQSRLIGTEPDGRLHTGASVLPRQGVAGIELERRMFWPVAVVLLTLPMLVLGPAIALFVMSPNAVSLLLLGASLAGYGMAAYFVWYTYRQRVRKSAPLLPGTVTFTAHSVRITEGATTLAPPSIVEVPFADLHTVDLLDPSDDAVSRQVGETGVSASGIVLVHGRRRDIIEGRPGTRTVALRGLGRTDALQIRESILTHRDDWLALQQRA